MICSAYRIESAMALTVAGTRFPPSYCASFRATRPRSAENRWRARSSHDFCCTATEAGAGLGAGTPLAEQAKHALAQLSPDRGQMACDIRQQFKQLSHGNRPEAAE
jgi:hypothetical protein